MSSSSLTFAFTNTAGNFLYVAAKTRGDEVTGITYNAVSMTLVAKIASDAGSNDAWVTVFGLAGPATGANNVVITTGITSEFIGGQTSSYSGVSQTGQPYVNSTATPNSNTAGDISLTDTGSSSWNFAAWGNQTGTTSAGTGTTQRQTSVIALSIGDSNGAVSAGSNSLQVTTVASNNWAIVMAGFTVPSSGPANVKTVDGLAKASVKTVDGLAIASVKTIDGLG